MRKYFAVVAAVALAACAIFGLEATRGTNDQLAYGYSQLAGFRQSAATALALGSIKVDDALEAQSLADKTRAGFDAARTALKGCVATDAKTGQSSTVTQMPGIVQAGALLVLQTIQCNPSSTPLDQLALANRVLLELTMYLNQRGIQ